jgi:hypothetical protein
VAACARRTGCNADEVEDVLAAGTDTGPAACEGTRLADAEDHQSLASQRLGFLHDHLLGGKHQLRLSRVGSHGHDSDGAT